MLRWFEREPFQRIPNIVNIKITHGYCVYFTMKTIIIDKITKYASTLPKSRPKREKKSVFVSSMT